MTVRDLVQQEICIDVVDDVCEELWIAMDGPIVLTEEGEKHFAEVLGYGVKLHNNGSDIVGIVNVDDEEGIWQNKLDKAKEFFESAAGYCPVDEYDKWFVV
jgi:hypothetical protein